MQQKKKNLTISVKLPPIVLYSSSLFYLRMNLRSSMHEVKTKRLLSIPCSQSYFFTFVIASLLHFYVCQLNLNVHARHEFPHDRQFLRQISAARCSLKLLYKIKIIKNGHKDSSYLRRGESFLLIVCIVAPSDEVRVLLIVYKKRQDLAGKTHIQKRKLRSEKLHILSATHL
jgi:hypothetical protein